MDETAFEKWMRQCQAQCDVGNFALARETLESLDMIEALEGQPPAGLYEYYFRRGRVFGELGELQAMDDAFTQALSLAAEQLGDLDACKEVWYWVLQLAREREAWGFLEQQCAAAAAFGKTVGSHSVRQLAAEHCAYAHRGLGKTESARRGAMTILRRLEKIGADKHRLQEWRDFLASTD